MSPLISAVESGQVGENILEHLLSLGTGPIPAEELECCAREYDRTEAWLGSTEDGVVNASRHLVLIKRISRSFPVEANIRFRIDASCHDPNALTLHAHCYASNGQFIGHARDFGAADTVGLCQFLKGLPGVNSTKQMIVPLPKTTYILLKVTVTEVNRRDAVWVDNVAPIREVGIDDDPPREIPMELLSGHEGPVSADDLTHFANIFELSGSWYNCTAEVTVKKNSPGIAVSRVAPGITMIASFDFHCGVNETNSRAVVFSAHCFDAKGKFLGGPIDFARSAHVGYYQYVSAEPGWNTGECAIRPLPATAFIVFRFVPWSVKVQRLKPRFDVRRQRVTEEEAAAVACTLRQGPPEALSVSILDSESDRLEESGQFRLIGNDHMGGQPGWLMAVKRLSGTDELRVSFKYDIEEVTGIGSRKAIALCVECYDGTGRLIGGARGYQHSDFIGFYQYVSGRAGRNVKTRLITPPARTTYVVIRLLPWDVQAIGWADLTADIDDWQVFTRGQWAEFLAAEPPPIRSGIWLVSGDGRTAVGHPEQLRHLLIDRRSGEHLEFVLVPDEDESLIRCAMRSFYSSQFLRLTEFLMIAIGHGVPCHIRASDGFLGTVPLSVSDHPLISLCNIADQ